MRSLRKADSSGLAGANYRIVRCINSDLLVYACKETNRGGVRVRVRAVKPGLRCQIS